MKRARVTTRSEAARARARPCPVSPDSLLALLDDADITVGQLCASTSALASLTADLVARKDESLQLAVAQVASSRSALLSHKTRVLGLAKRLFRKQCKRIVAEVEAEDVSMEQLRVWAAVAGTGQVCPFLDCAFTPSLLLALPRLVRSPATGMSSILGLPFIGELGSVATGDGLRVMSAAGPGLKWFEPHSRNEFCVVLAQADGGVPLWLTAGDVVADFILQLGMHVDSGVRASATATVRVDLMQLGTVSVVYGGVCDAAPATVLHLSVCGTPVGDAAGDSDWCVRVPRKPLAGHECVVAGTRVRTLAVIGGSKYGLAVSTDEKWLVVGLDFQGALSVYSLPGGQLVRTFGGRGDGPLQFQGLRRLCFTPNGHLIVVDKINQLLQEVTLEGEFVRFIGVGEFGDCSPFCVAVHDDVIAVGCYGGTGPRVVLFEFGRGTVTSRFGKLGTAPGQLSNYCTGIRFTPDGSHVIVAENDAERVSLFTAAGEFVMCVGVGVLRGGIMDVLQSSTGEYVVADSNNCRVCVFSADDSELVRSWGVSGASDECWTTLAAAGQHLYVMDSFSGSLTVFQ